MVVAVWIIVLAALIIAAGLVEAWVKRGRYHPTAILAGPRQTDTPELGTEAIDMDHVRTALRTNNMATTLPGRHASLGQYRFMPSSPIRFKADETYARNWFQAFGKKPKGTTK